MLFDSPLPGKLKPHKVNYPKHPLAAGRPADTRLPRVTHDFGPSGIPLEPAMDWRGGESDIFGRKIPAGHYEDFHQGLDISTGACGDAVHAAGPGIVEIAGPNKNGAIVVVINHGVVNDRMWRTRYAHLQADGLIPARDANGKRTRVAAGAVIGRIGSTGAFSTGCHLHFAVTRNDIPVDPWRRLRQNTSVDPDLPRPAAPAPLLMPIPEVDMPKPISDKDYLAGQVAVITNVMEAVQVLEGPQATAKEVRRIDPGNEEVWLPTCWVKGDVIGTSEKWLTRWHGERWEFAHSANVTLTLFESGTEDDGDVGIVIDASADIEPPHGAVDDPF